MQSLQWFSGDALRHGGQPLGKDAPEGFKSEGRLGWVQESVRAGLCMSTPRQIREYHRTEQ